MLSVLSSKIVFVVPWLYANFLIVHTYKSKMHMFCYHTQVAYLFQHESRSTACSFLFNCSYFDRRCRVKLRLWLWLPNWFSGYPRWWRAFCNTAGRLSDLWRYFYILFSFAICLKLHAAKDCFNGELAWRGFEPLGLR